jgi:putative phage-type endonuclease
VKPGFPPAKKGIGSSDAPELFLGNQLALAMEKLGLMPERSDTPEMEWGRRLEPIIAEKYAEVTGRTLTKGENIASPDYPFMLATPDYCVDKERGVECKTSGTFMAKEWGEPGTDEVPERYLIQTHHQMIVMGWVVVDIPVLIGGSNFAIYTVERNKELCELIVETERNFWELIQRGELPPINWDDPLTPKLIKTLYTPKGGTTLLPPGSEVLATEYEDLGTTIKDLENRRAVVQAKLIEMQGDHQIGILPDDREISRKLIEECTVSYTRAPYYSFRIKQSKRRSNAEPGYPQLVKVS